MKKAILIIIGLLVVVGLVWYFSSSDTPTEQVNTNVENAREEQVASDNEEIEEELSGSGSLESILGFGENIRCEFAGTFDGQSSEGVFMTDGERFRVNSTVSGPEMGAITSNVIDDGDYMYTWGTTPQGEMAVRMASPEDETGDSVDYPDDMAGEESYVDFNQQVEYDCNRWNVDSSAFVPPSDVEFTDMEAMMQEAMQGMPEGFEMPEGY